jgi:hypothetical protein
MLKCQCEWNDCGDAVGYRHKDNMPVFDPTFLPCNDDATQEDMLCDFCRRVCKLIAQSMATT